MAISLVLAFYRLTSWFNYLSSVLKRISFPVLFTYLAMVSPSSKASNGTNILDDFDRSVDDILYTLSVGMLHQIG